MYLTSGFGQAVLFAVLDRQLGLVIWLSPALSSIAGHRSISLRARNVGFSRGVRRVRGGRSGSFSQGREPVERGPELSGRGRRGSRQAPFIGQPGPVIEAGDAVRDSRPKFPVPQVPGPCPGSASAGQIGGGGYIRASSAGQNPDRQLDGIEVDRVFTDTVSGKSTTRPQLQAMLAFVRDGDAVIVHSMDRLARNLEDLRRLVRELTPAGRGHARAVLGPAAASGHPRAAGRRPPRPGRPAPSHGVPATMVARRAAR